MKPLKQPEKDRIVELRKKHLTYGQIAERVGHSVPTIKKVCTDAGLGGERYLT